MRKLFILLLLASPLFLTGQVCENRCLDFDGINDWVTLSPTPLPANSNFTVEMWFRSSNTNGNTNCLGNFRRLFVLGTPNNRLEFGECGGNLSGYWNALGGTNTQAFGGPNVNDNQWRHVAFVRTGNQLEVYIDGVSISVVPFVANFDPVDFRIGSWLGVYFASAQWMGQMDEVRLWNTARTQQQINDLYALLHRRHHAEWLGNVLETERRYSCGKQSGSYHSVLMLPVAEMMACYRQFQPNGQLQVIFYVPPSPLHMRYSGSGAESEWPHQPDL